MFVTNWISTTKIQKISEITNFFRHYFLSRTEVFHDYILFCSSLQYRFSNPSVSLSKGSSTSNQAFLLRRKDVNRPTRCSEPLRSKVGGPSKVFAMLCGMGPPYYSSLIRTALLQLADWGGMATICYSLMIGGAWGTNC